MVKAAAQAAQDNVNLVAESLHRAADAFRVGDVRSGRRELVQIATALRTLALVTRMLTSSDDQDAANHVSAQVLFTCLRATLAVLQRRQRGGDWPAVADLLDGDLASILEQWATVLASIRDRACAAGTLRRLAARTA
jgi:hypothetical protein